MDSIILLSAVLKHEAICRKLWKIVSFRIIIDLRKHEELACVGVCVCACTHNSDRKSLIVCIVRVLLTSALNYMEILK